MARHVRKGDLVVVISGAGSKRRVGERQVRDTTPRKVLRVIVGSCANTSRVVVEGVNIRKKNVRPTQSQPRGGVIEKEMPIHISNVMPVSEGKATRIRFETRKDGAKVRVGVKSGQPIGQELRKASR
ncbi:MAG: 50S ribosomal protein L24 [Phycisphaeraceae bacterium]|nr:50S ribosomal protein L24 [Phycisphaeraceae bacterium]